MPLLLATSVAALDPAAPWCASHKEYCGAPRPGLVAVPGDVLAELSMLSVMSVVAPSLLAVVPDELELVTEALRARSAGEVLLVRGISSVLIALPEVAHDDMERRDRGVMVRRQDEVRRAF